MPAKFKFLIFFSIIFLLVVVGIFAFPISRLQEKKQESPPVEIKETSKSEVTFNNGEYEIEGEKFVNGELISVGLVGQAIMVIVGGEEKQFFLANEVVVARGDLQKGVRQETPSALAGLNPGLTVWLKLNAEGKISQITFFENL